MLPNALVEVGHNPFALHQGRFTAPGMFDEISGDGQTPFVFRPRPRIALRMKIHVTQIPPRFGNVEPGEIVFRTDPSNVLPDVVGLLKLFVRLIDLAESR